MKTITCFIKLNVYISDILTHKQYSWMDNFNTIKMLMVNIKCSRLKLYISNALNIQYIYIFLINAHVQNQYSLFFYNCLKRIKIYDNDRHIVLTSTQTSQC